jgi:hypothetical protein
LSQHLCQFTEPTPHQFKTTVTDFLGDGSQPDAGVILLPVFTSKTKPGGISLPRLATRKSDRFFMMP